MRKNGKIWLSIVIATLVLLGAGASASANHLFRRGYGGRYYGHGYGPEYAYHGYGYGYYGPAYGYPYSPRYYSPYYSHYLSQYDKTRTGTLNLEITPKPGNKAQVYVDNALASEFKHKHTPLLTPGKYRIEVRKEGYQSRSRTVYLDVFVKMQW